MHTPGSSREEGQLLEVLEICLSFLTLGVQGSELLTLFLASHQYKPGLVYKSYNMYSSPQLRSNRLTVSLL